MSPRPVALAGILRPRPPPAFDVSIPARSLLTPSQLNALARSLLEDSFGLVEVEGELGGVSRPASGHLYFTLKDRAAQVRCAMFKPKSQWLRFRPADGLQVVARGRVTLYEPRGEYQLIVEYMEPAGEGALLRAFEALKRRLADEGLFDAARKRALPPTIRRLGVLSSPGGAAIHDVLSVIARRFPLLEVELLPVPVQGDGAATAIRTMLQRADASARYDVLLLTRGGGAIEDLQAFNDEALARAIAACRTVTVSAIGHEIDFTIADFVADVRAPTPSAAAEALTPDSAVLGRRLQDVRRVLLQHAGRALRQRAQRLDHAHARLALQRPDLRIARTRQRLDDAARRLRLLGPRPVVAARSMLVRQNQRLCALHPRVRLAALRERLQQQRLRLQAHLARRLERHALNIAALGRALHAVGPQATLDRGYAIVQREDDARIVGRAEDAPAGVALRIRLAEGSIDAVSRG